MGREVGPIADAKCFGLQKLTVFFFDFPTSLFASLPLPVEAAALATRSHVRKKNHKMNIKELIRNSYEHGVLYIL